jgi:hypothetical protein
VNAVQDLTAPFLAATTSELDQNGATRRLRGLADQAALFPHHGTMSIEDDTLVLSGYRSISRDEIESIEQRFVPEYTRFAAGGSRGGFPSFGFFKSQGAPLVLTLTSGEQLLMLIGFEVLSGTTKNADWLGVLQRFIQGPS